MHTFRILTVIPQNHRITEWLCLETTSGSHLVQPPYSSMETWSRLTMTVSRWFLKFATGGDPTITQGNLFQCLVTCTSVSWCSKGTISVPLCAHSLFSWLWALLKRAWLHPLCTLPSGIYTHVSDTLETPFLQERKSQLSQPHFIREVLQSLHHLVSPPLDSF